MSVSRLVQRRRIDAPAEALEPRVLLATFMVGTTADAGPGSLRQAILDANAADGADVIAFNIEGPGIHTIRPLSPLPQVTGPTTVDAATQPGYAGSPLIELDGSAAGEGADGVVVAARPSILRGFVINRFVGNGVVARLATTSDVRPPPRVTIEGNRIGTDAAGATALPNGAAGILVAAAFTSITAGNVISGNRGAGVLVSVPVPSEPLHEVIVRDNRIGTDAAGRTAIGNGKEGVDVADGAFARVTIFSNLISGNGASGVRIGRSPGGSYFAGLRSNRIGTDEGGARAIPNGIAPDARARDGVTCTAGSIVDISQRNVISGNRGNGVAVLEGGSAGVGSNYIGTDVAGNAPLGNGGHGIHVVAPAGIGFILNVVSANGRDGVRFERVVADGAGSIFGNRVGTNAAGTAPLGNAGHGLVLDRCRNVKLRNPPESGTFMQRRNVFSANGGHGVLVLGDPAQRQPSNIVIGWADIGVSNRITQDASMGNRGDGIHIGGAVGVRVDYAVVSASGGNGVTIRDLAGVPSTGVEVVGNTIGGFPAVSFTTSSWPARPDLGNRGHGVAIVNSPGNRVGGQRAPENGTGQSYGNAIFYNGGAGVRVEGAASVRNFISDNGIDFNGGLGIDLGAEGVTPNDPLDADAGPNGLQNFPTITSVTLDAPITTNTTDYGHNRATVRVGLQAAPRRTFRVELYWSPAADPSGHGEGARSLVYVTVTTNAAGDGTGVATLPRPNGHTPFLGGYFTATAISADGDTSEFSPPVRAWPGGPAVVARHVFYNNSAYDGGDPAPNAADDAAVDASRRVLLPNNYAYWYRWTNYDKGINGVMVDVANLPADRTLTADDFEFRVGNTATPAAWPDGPPPTSVTVRRGAGVGGSDRVTLVWPDRAIVNQWLQVRLNLPSAQGPFRSDVFYVGNLVGDAAPTSPGDSVVDDADVERVRTYLGRVNIPVARQSMGDYSDVNYDSRVDGQDVAIVEANRGARLVAFVAPPNRVPETRPARRSGYGSVATTAAGDAPASFLLFGGSPTRADPASVLHEFEPDVLSEAHTK